MGRRYQRRLRGRLTYVNHWVKYLLCLANSIFLIFGAIFLVFGVIAFVESGGIPLNSNVSALHWLCNLTILCIGVGVITLLVSVAGFFGSLRENRCLLRLYYSILILLFLSEVANCVIFFIYRDSAIRKLEDLIRITFITQYRELGFEDTTNFMDFIQKELTCCGAKSYLDWTANIYFSCNNSNTGPEACGVPYSCCRHMNNINVNVINTSCGFGAQKSLTSLTNGLVWRTGCVQALINLVETNIGPVACGVGSVAVLQIVAILLAKTLHTQIGDQLRLLRQESLVC